MSERHPMPRYGDIRHAQPETVLVLLLLTACAALIPALVAEVSMSESTQTPTQREPAQVAR